MSITDIMRWAYSNMDYPWVLLLAVLLIPLIIWILNQTFIVVKDDLRTLKEKARVRKIMYFTRSIIIILVLIAIASPYVLTEKIIEGDPFIMLLVDNSSSMSVFEDVSERLSTKLRDKTNTEVKLIGSDLTSNIGDAILNNLQPHSSIILLSDGNANAGADLGDVALFASKLNATINAINLNTVQNEANVVVLGPTKALEGSESAFSVLIDKLGNIGSVQLTVTIDDEVVIDESYADSVYNFKRKLPQGTHKITAKIGVSDFFPNNNIYYKTVKVVPQPKVLLLTEKSSPLEEFLRQLYIVETKASLPNNLNDYYATIINDIPAATLDSISDVINDYVADGNGMVVFGGEKSYENGNYKNSIFETMLPVLVGTPEKKEGDVNIAVVIDISGSTGTPFGRFKSTADFSKSATIDIIKNVRLDTRIGVIAFNTQSYLLSELSPAFTKKDVSSTIARIRWGGGTNIASGLLKAVGILSTATGSKNIVILSDGKTQARSSALEAAKFAANAGIKIYTIGVGPTTDEEFMMDIADLTNGIYFRATEETRLRLIFGPVDEGDPDSGKMELVILNQNHFITHDFEPASAFLYGFNQVSPKGAARLLATSSTGQPILTVWRLGLGRVAAYSTDDGSKWAGSLLGEANSKLMTRTMNWAIGDPERKSASLIDTKDTRVKEPTEIIVKSPTPPTAEGVVFYKIDHETYSGVIIPETTGFKDVAGAAFAVNYEAEFEQLGVNKELNNVVASTSGKMYNVGDVDDMVNNAKTLAKREINTKDYLRTPFVILAIIVFLVEIFIRRIFRRE